MRPTVTMIVWVVDDDDGNNRTLSHLDCIIIIIGAFVSLWCNLYILLSTEERYYRHAYLSTGLLPW